MDSADARCGLLAAEQHGCVTLEQAARARLSGEAVRRRVRSGEWRRMHPGVYALRAAPHTWEQRLMAATLWAGPTAVISGTTAGALWEFPGFGRTSTIELSHRGAKRSRRGIHVRRVGLPESHVANFRGIPVTAPARTLADVARVVTRERLDMAFHFCLHNHLTTLPVLEALAVERSGRGFPGSGRLRESLETYGNDPAGASPLEARLAQRLASSSLPPPRRQFRVRVEGRTRYIDFAWPDRMVGVEVDGYQWHSSRTSWQQDRQRLTALRRAGWTILHATQEDVDRRFGELILELETLLR